MIQNDKQLETTQQRIVSFQQLLMQARRLESESNYRAMSSGYLAEIDKMQGEIREYLSQLPRRVKVA